MGDSVYGLQVRAVVPIRLTRLKTYIVKTGKND